MHGSIFNMGQIPQAIKLFVNAGGIGTLRDAWDGPRMAAWEMHRTGRDPHGRMGDAPATSSWAEAYMSIQPAPPHPA